MSCSSKAIQILLLSLFASLFFGCQQTTQGPTQTSTPLGLKAAEIPASGAIEEKRHKGGNRVYVPCYSQIRVAEGRTYKLSINLSIRNTSVEEEMVVTLVDYHDSSGKLVKHHASDKVVIKPLETVDFFVAERDPSGGSGANFIVEWEKNKSLSTPVVEAVMIGTGGGQGVSFVTQGVAIP